MAEYYIFIVIGVAILFLGIWLLSGIRVMLEYERLVIFRLGKYTRTTGPGLVYIIPIIETAKKVDMRIITQDIPRQELMTRDNIPVLANTVVYFKVERPEDAVIKIENYVYAVRQYTQAALRDTMGTLELDQVLTERDQIAIDIQKSVDRETNEWGIDIKAIKIQEIELPAEMKRAFAKQAEAERGKRAAIIQSEGELKASDNLAEAAKKLSTERGALQLRTLQTIRDIAQDPSEKIVIFMPSEISDLAEKITKKK
ncbi:MAG: slipin family protein [Candidatus Heimdallarchaeota archaeon]|nr:slipin family protein [Candidatus Heimdallarchaeota archaeon]MCK4255013.1 slipin family protein [Candidatus Heimdallarchaeota archaeon]